MGQRRYPIHLAFFLIAYYCTNCMYQSFITLYYGAVRLSSAQIGTINAVVALVSIAAQPVWGTVGDRTKDRRLLIALLAVASAAAMYSFRLFSAYAPLLLIAGLFSCFYTSLQPMGDSIILRELNRLEMPFGPFRLAGGLAYGLAGLFLGRVLRRPGQEPLIPVYVALMCLLTALSTLSLPAVAGGQSSAGRKLHFSELFRMRELMRLLLFMAPIQMTMGYFYTFFSPYYMSLPGATSTQLGLCYFITAASEIPFLLVSDRLFERFGAGRLMCVSAATLCARWLIMGTTRNLSVIIASQLLHGWGFIVMTVCMAKYISQTVPEALQASGQMLLAIVSFGVARAAGNLGGGLLAECIGRQQVFFVCAAICAATLATKGVVALRRRRKAGIAAR